MDGLFALLLRTDTAKYVTLKIGYIYIEIVISFDVFCMQFNNCKQDFMYEKEAAKTSDDLK
jgi:hypothetical protein